MIPATYGGEDDDECIAERMAAFTAQRGASTRRGANEGHATAEPNA